MKEIKETNKFVIYKIEGAYKRSIIGTKLTSEGFKFIEARNSSRISYNGNDAGEQWYYIHSTKKFTGDLTDILFVRKNSQLEKIAKEIIERID